MKIYIYVWPVSSLGFSINELECKKNFETLHYFKGLKRSFKSGWGGKRSIKQRNKYGPGCSLTPGFF